MFESEFVEGNLNSAVAIDFLFRTAYLYEELKAVAIKNIAREQHADISKKNVRNAHKEHPEFLELLGDYVGIPRAKLQATNQNYELEFRLISARTPTTAPVSSEPMYTSVLMDRYYRNNASHDVFFSCEDGSFDNSGKGQNNKGQNYDDQNYDDQSHIGKSDIDLENKTVKPVEASTLGAHRFVLSQWPYFKAMFESEFEEGCSGAKTIRVKGVRLRTFQIMIQFMYMGTLKSDIATLYEDNAAGQASWEGLYIAADRYRIDDLRKLALTTIERKLDSIAAIDFLFRSAYLYPELRDPVIKYIAKEHHAEISKREVREAHKDHPEFSDLLGELYEAFHELMANKGFLDSRPGILYRR
ncbi:hypothetical protein CPB97_008766 [Podila verticillata]|nr:hypothetical protein CPB97_008766 [Podila verticillata]